jgi:hypothetical protein
MMVLDARLRAVAPPGLGSMLKKPSIESTLACMPSKMTRDEARAFAARWEQVAEAEREELRATPIERKFAQLGALMESARALGWKTTDRREVEAVRVRWNRLAELHKSRG